MRAAGRWAAATAGAASRTEPAQLGHGQFIGEIGANLLVPYSSPHSAYTATTAGGPTSNNDFPPPSVDVAPYISLGYLAHQTAGACGPTSGT